MSMLADMSRREIFDWCAYHMPKITAKRAELVAKLQEYGALLASCNGALEHKVTAARFVDDVMDAADGSLADEARAWIEAEEG